MMLELIFFTIKKNYLDDFLMIFLQSRLDLLHDFFNNIIEDISDNFWGEFLDALDTFQSS